MLDPNLKVMGEEGGWSGRERGAPSSRSVAKYEVLANGYTVRSNGLMLTSNGWANASNVLKKTF